MLLERYEKLDMVDHWSPVVDVDENKPPEVGSGLVLMEWRLGLAIFIEYGVLRISPRPISLRL